MFDSEGLLVDLEAHQLRLKMLIEKIEKQNANEPFIKELRSRLDAVTKTIENRKKYNQV